MTITIKVESKEIELIDQIIAAQGLIATACHALRSPDNMTSHMQASVAETVWQALGLLVPIHNAFCEPDDLVANGFVEAAVEAERQACIAIAEKYLDHPHEGVGVVVGEIMIDMRARS